MLIGQSKHTVDAKNRLIIPNKFRSDLGDRFIITRGLDGCLYAYPASEWHEREAALNALPEAQGRDIKRFFFAFAEEVAPDSQGRIIIPAHLREYADLQKDVVITGGVNKAEIWSADRWNNFEKNIDSAEIEKLMLELGF